MVVRSLGFTYAKHFDKTDRLATVYRDDVEIAIVQKGGGEVMSNQARHGSGYDAYIDTRELVGVDLIDIGVGLIADKAVYFENSNYLHESL